MNDIQYNTQSRDAASPYHSMWFWSSDFPLLLQSVSVRSASLWILTSHTQRLRFLSSHIIQTRRLQNEGRGSEQSFGAGLTVSGTIDGAQMKSRRAQERRLLERSWNEPHKKGGMRGGAFLRWQTHKQSNLVLLLKFCSKRQTYSLPGCSFLFVSLSIFLTKVQVSLAPVVTIWIHLNANSGMYPF